MVFFFFFQRFLILLFDDSAGKPNVVFGFFSLLNQLLPFLKASETTGENNVLVFCS